MTIHNHGSEEGEGLACPELRLPSGELKGKCLLVEDLVAGKISVNQYRSAFMVISEGIHNPGTDMVPIDPIAKVKMAVKKVIDGVVYESGPNSVKPVYEIYVVSFTYILGGWKGMVSTDMSDGMYYEVTYNTTRQETYVDAYVKTHNVVFPD